MAIPSILARIAAGVATEAVEDSEASIMATLAEHLGVPFPKDSDSLTLPVASSAISAIGYKSPDTITVVFKRGGSLSYDFMGSLDEFAAFALSPSKGAFFNAHFKDR